MDQSGTLRVLVIARQPVARAGLRALLDDRPDVEVVGQAASVAEADHLAGRLRPVAAVTSWDVTDREGLAALCEALAVYEAPLLLLAAEGASLTVGEQAGPRGVLSADATPDAVALALHAVAAGLVVVDALFAPTLTAAAGVPTRGLLPGGPLTDREREVLELMALGLPNKSIAVRLEISEHTVKFHVGSIFGKLDVGSRTEAVTVAARRGLIAL